MGIIIFAILLGLIPAYIAKGKGKSFVGWWVYGSLLFIIALPHALMMEPDKAAIEAQQISEGMKKCPYCAELIKEEAKICRYCQKELPQSESKKCRKCKREIMIDEQICPSCQAIQ